MDKEFEFALSEIREQRPNFRAVYDTVLPVHKEKWAQMKEVDILSQRHNHISPKINCFYFKTLSLALRILLKAINKRSACALPVSDHELGFWILLDSMFTCLQCCVILLFPLHSMSYIMMSKFAIRL